MSLARSLLIAAVLAVPATVASADPVAWSRTTMAAAPSYFPSGGTAMVVAVGEGAQPAAAALLQALQASSQLELASDASALGKVDGMSDDQIVKRAFARPISRVAIVRVFPAGGSVKAVVTVYAAQGQVTTAFTLMPTKDLADNPNPKAASDGVGRDEMQSVSASVGDSDKGSGGDITYSRQQVVGITAYGGLMQFDSVTFAQNGHPISDTPGLYDAVGMHAEAKTYRADAASHDKWAWRGGVMTTVGLTAFISFGTYALIAGVNDDYSNSTMPVQNDHSLAWGLTAVSAGVMVLGIVEWAVHPAPAPLSADDAIALVDKHNAKKKQTTSLHFAPVATSTGGGLTFGGSW
jgi:hypothetical protein